MLIKNGFLINPSTNIAEVLDVRVENGIISEIGILDALDNEEVLDIKGLTIAPGLIDTHIHFRDPGLTYRRFTHRFSRCCKGWIYICYLHGKHKTNCRFS